MNILLGGLLITLVFIVIILGIILLALAIGVIREEKRKRLNSLSGIRTDKEDVNRGRQPEDQEITGNQG